MLINFKKAYAGILNIPLPRTEEEKKKDMSPERAAHVNPRFVSLVPGINELSDSVWNKIKENERIQAYMQRNEIVLLYAEKVEDKKASTEKIKVFKDLTVKEFKELSSKEQEAIIAETEQVSLLHKFKKVTKEGSLAALNDRIDRLEHPEKYVDRD